MNETGGQKGTNCVPLMWLIFTGGDRINIYGPFELTSLVKDGTRKFSLFRFVSRLSPLDQIHTHTLIFSCLIAMCVLSDGRTEFFSRKLKWKKSRIYAPFNHAHILFFDFITNYSATTTTLLVPVLVSVSDIHHVCSQLLLLLLCGSKTKCVVMAYKWIHDIQLIRCYRRLLLFSIINYSFTNENK